MKVINEKTSRMPGVTFDPDTRIMTIEGEAYPEDVTAAFAPIFTALEEILAENAGGTTTLDFQMQYFNSGSSRKILEIIRLLDEVGADNKVIWRADPEDDEMIGHGKRFSRALAHASFEVIEEEL